MNRPRARRLARLAILALGLCTIAPESAQAQSDRYELGRRVREFEVEWDRVEDAGARARASRSLKEAVTLFFTFRLADAGRAITDARFTLRPGIEPTDSERWAASLRLLPETRLLDGSAPTLAVTVASFYATEKKKPEGVTIRLDLAGSKVEAPFEAIPSTFSIPLKDVPTGDHWLSMEVVQKGRSLSTVRQLIAKVDRLTDRLAALKKTSDAWPTDLASATVDRETARTQLSLVESLASKTTLESDFPAAKIIETLEAQMGSIERGEPYLGPSNLGQSWLTLVTRSGKKIPARVFVPDAASKGTPLPMVVALHGAGGSENMFFESYGNGAIVECCRERGWILISPRSSGFGKQPVIEIIDELAKIYPVDTARVMIVGHSMGASQATTAASSAPGRYRGIATLGGGGAIRPNPGVKTLPFFIGIGTEDFAIQGARSLAESLKRVEAPVTYREYPTIEHLAIVQVAMVDVFKFFDEQMK